MPGVDSQICNAPGRRVTLGDGPEAPQPGQIVVCTKASERSAIELYQPAGPSRTNSITQEDPIGLAGGLNLYGFANGDPVNFSDPFGLQAEGCCGDEAAGETEGRQRRFVVGHSGTSGQCPTRRV